ncbi:uncharacterized protein LOC111705801 isoform X2 [Eurytemora carolleeae]|uniref:uncharacterized protein LOC111705801 isoform X2 n=1 Tax=Eurytemora carolleeae TaxID=1294199 RepID=UPI000C76F124|nr:uncharacterized protein LOC111705801 isoform X2 [Eurytemora carolleeae]|eukprot:XP_023334238.1 uncharacterized protein LOC111705801 isoform X2 [Eurytemora affinis]
MIETDSSKKKSSLCKHWAAKGRCDRGDACEFAHGKANLANPGQSNSKTMMCRYVQSGQCKSGDACKFAHDPSEIRKSVLVGDNFKSDIYKITLCKNFEANGFCSVGFNCLFAHGEGELRRSLVSKKDQMCKNWEDGSCKFGDKCLFAHGEAELQKVTADQLKETNPLYKTKLCAKFKEDSMCEHGDKCMFAHGEDELIKLDENATAKFKKMNCKNMVRDGHCQFGDNCFYNHGNSGSSSSNNSGQLTGTFNHGNYGYGYDENGYDPSGYNASGYNASGAYAGAGQGYGGAGQGYGGAGQGGYGGSVQGGYGGAGQGGYGGSVQGGYGGAGQGGYGGSGQGGYGGAGGTNSYQGGNQWQPPLPSAPRPETTNSTAKTPSNYKTMICKSWLEVKNCKFENSCLHAHGEIEQRPFPQKEAGFKENLCKYFEETGQCKWNNECKFAHGEKELQKPQLQPGHYPAICKRWINRECLYGINCSFQHAIPKQNTEWKITKCKSMGEEEPCKYGDKCNFAHSEAQLRTKEDNVAFLSICHQIQAMRTMGMSSLLQMSQQMGQGLVGTGSSSGYNNTGSGYNMGGNGYNMSGNGFNMAGNGYNMGGGGQNMGGGGQSMVGAVQNNLNRGINGPNMGNQGMMGGGLAQMGGNGPNMNNQNGAAQQTQNSYNFGNNRSQDGFKTSPCSAYASTGVCPNGMNCRFAHSAQELRTPNGGAAKAVLCKTWLEEGSCARQGQGCQFAHGQKELGSQTDGSYILKMEPCRNMKEKGVCPYGDVCQFSHDMKKRSFQDMQGEPDKRLDGKFKVVLCDKHPSCPMGEMCNYAHGYEELYTYRAKQVPNYKKSICKTWEETGNCQWEKTCMFAHGAEELRYSTVHNIICTVQYITKYAQYST